MDHLLDSDVPPQKLTKPLKIDGFETEPLLVGGFLFWPLFQGTIWG